KGIDDVPIDEQWQLDGLDGPVDVVVDERGVPHVFATTEHDALFVEGYLMARDRLAQFEFYRRALQGTMSEIISPVLAPGIVDQDIAARQLGFHRMAKDIRQSLADDDPVLEAMQAFCDGVNRWIDKVRSGEASLPAGLGGLIPADRIADWTPTDILTIARYMSYDLSKSASDEITLTNARLAIAEAFPANSPDSLIAARAGILHDLWPLAPAVEAPTRDGFPNVGDDSGSRAFWQPGPLPTRAPSRFPSHKVLGAAAAWFESVEKNLLPYVGLGGGSNNWAVDGQHAENGFPLLASDPHLSLLSPNFFWQVHLNTTRAGGDLDVMGLALFGTPGVLLGYNRHIAWGLTVTNFDVEDVYYETIVPGTGGEPDKVVFKGQQVPIQTITETINVAGGQPKTVTIEVVPHHGPIVPGTHEPGGTEALSRRWVGHEPSNEVAALMGMMKASNIDEVEQALDSFEVGSQNWMVVTSDGDIYWSTSSKVPLREPAALSYDPSRGTGFAPCFVLPGDGGYEWTGEYLSDRYLPHDLNPSKGYLSTANQDQVGVTHDGNPFDDEFYIGWYFDLGHRNGRISERLEQLVASGNVSHTDMSQLQGDHVSPLGRLLAPSFVDALDMLIAEHEAPGSHPDLSALADELDGRMQRLQAARDYLDGWSYDTPAAVEGTPTASEISDSVATSIFNAALTRLLHLVYDDEIARIGVRPSAQFIARSLERLVLDPQSLSSYSAASSDSVLWDDLDTEGTTETRHERMARAVAEAVEFLEGRFGTDMSSWRWGELHTVRLRDITGVFGATLSIPPEGDEQFPNGFPRPGDMFVVDASHYDIWKTDDFRYFSGPQQRLVVEMTPDGPRIWNARPGGQSQDPEDPHFADDVELWRNNQAPPLFFDEADIVEHAESHVRIAP
ncbi:MAG: penicillin acylase family protein, partial [Deltaproteobacteria bacterium]